MILSRGNFCSVLGPAGVFAGGRFVLRRFTSVPRRHIWSRIVLQWRKTRRGKFQKRSAPRMAAVANSQTRAATALSRVSWFQHFHLNFVLAGRDQLWRTSKPIQVHLHGERTQRAPGPKRAVNEMLLRQASELNGLSGAIAGRPRESMDGSRSVSSDARARSKDDIRTEPSAPLLELAWQTNKWSPIARHLMPSHRPGLSRHIVTRTPKTRSTAQTKEGTKAVRRMETWEFGQQSRRPRNEIADILKRDRNSESDVAASGGKRSVPPLSHRSRDREVTRSADGKNAELIWRRSSLTPSEYENFDPAGSGAAHSTRSSTNSASANQAVPDVERLIERAAGKQMTQLDPALLDRLTDNVISRVEKRIKIEQQRRGL